jgi:hypothetical protein
MYISVKFFIKGYSMSQQKCMHVLVLLFSLCSFSAQAEFSISQPFIALDSYLNEQGQKIDLPNHLLTGIVGAAITGGVLAGVYNGYYFVKQLLEDRKPARELIDEAESLLDKATLYYDGFLLLFESFHQSFEVGPNDFKENVTSALEITRFYEEALSKLNIIKYIITWPAHNIDYPFIYFVNLVSKDIDSCLIASQKIEKRIERIRLGKVKEVYCLETLQCLKQKLDETVDALLSLKNNIETHIYEYQNELNIQKAANKIPLVIVLNINR